MPILTDLLPPDVTAAVLDMLDAQDVLRTFRGVPTIVALLPSGWEFQAHRPLREIEQLCFVRAGVPLRLWPTCPTLPDGLVCLLRHCGGYAVHEDIRGNLYLQMKRDDPFHLWRTEDSVQRLSSGNPIMRLSMSVGDFIWIRLMSARDRSRLRAMRECDPSNLYDYEAPYQK